MRDGRNPGVGFPIDRRAVVFGVAAFAVMPAGCSKVEVASQADQLAFIKTLAAMVIPDTDTPGAGNARVAHWVLNALRKGMRGGSEQTLFDLEKRLSKLTAPANFAKSVPQRQLTALRVLDDQLEFVPGSAPAKSSWGTIKSLILRAYYTSEVGASKELRYELVPARFDADVPITPGYRAWSSDANARNFG